MYSNVFLPPHRNTLDQMMTKLLTNKISQTTEDEEEQKCEKEKLDVLSTSKLVFATYYLLLSFDLYIALFSTTLF